MKTFADGQLATSSTAIFTGGQDTNYPSEGNVVVCLSLANTSSSLTQTILIKSQRQGGTARLIRRVVLAANESATIDNIPLMMGDVLLGQTTTASTVDYILGESPGGGPSLQVFDSNGSIKQVNGTSITGATTITSTSATAFVAGPNGATNPTLKVDGSVSSEAGGLSITGAADAAGVALAAIGSNTNEPLTLDAKGSGVISIGTVSTGGAVVRTKVATVAVGGTAIGNANAVGEGYTRVTGADNTAAVILPASVATKVCTVKNAVTNKVLIIFPPVSSQINANGTNNAYNIAAGATRTFRCFNSTLWETDPETIA